MKTAQSAFAEMAQYASGEAPKVFAATGTIKPHERLVLVSGATYTVYLPYANECFGWYCVYCTAGSANVTIADHDETPSNYTSGALTASGDYLLLFCNGIQWLEVKEQTT